MPKGMFLKSEGVASSLSDPTGSWTLARYCAENGLAYGDRGVPVSLENFIRYALAFQQKLVPEVEEVMVEAVEPSNNGFELRLANGSVVKAGKVVVATGLEHAAHMPPQLALLPRELVSHTADHNDLSCFRGRDVTVIGGGQSALETAALLSEEGASVHLLVRKRALCWNQEPRIAPPPVYQRMLYPGTSLGHGPEVWAYSQFPMLFRYLPQRARFTIVKTRLGPAGGWWLRNRVIGRLHILTGNSLQNIDTRGGRLVLKVAGPDGEVSSFFTDHLIAGTGYKFDVRRLPFLTEAIRSRLRTENNVPVLSSDFESSVPGLYFSGLASASYFGPVMRFLAGTHYTARTISRHIDVAREPNSSRPFFLRTRFKNAENCQ